MFKRERTWSLVVVLAIGSVWACGDDSDDSDGGGGSGGTAGAAGSGKAGSATAGKTSGGSSGSSSMGGSSAGEAGEGGSGMAGDNTVGGMPSAGEGGTAGGGGLDLGGAAGSAGAGGQGGAGGAGPGSLEANCTTVCAAQTALDCSYGDACVAGCVATGDPESNAATVEYAAMIACQAAQLSASDYECSVQGAGPDMPAPKAAGACEDEVCAFTCAEGAFFDVNAFDRCGC